MRRFTRVTVLLLVLSLLASACTLLGADTTTTTAPVGTTASEGTTTTTPSEPATTTASTVTTTEAPATTTAPTPDLGPLLADLEDLMSITEELRGLRFIAEPTTTILTREELAERVRADIAEDLDPAELARDQEALRILGVLDGTLDLGEFYTELLAEQVAGFYDSETLEMVIQATPEGLTEYDKMIIVHELTHALTDQHFEFGPLMDELIEAEEYDAQAALASLVEGDATKVESLYVMSLEREALLEIVAAFDEVESPIFDSAPYFLQESLVAPYIEGLDFVERQFAIGGWSAVELAYVSLPRTTEAILHQEVYEAPHPVITVELPGEIPDGYEVGEESTWGESGLRSLLGDAVLPAQLVAAVAGWGGDRYRVLWNGEGAIFQMHYIGDEPNDTAEFEAAFRDYLEAVAPDDARWWVMNNGEYAAVVIASDPAAGTGLVKSLQADGYR